jgi:hypothetical protein
VAAYQEGFGNTGDFGVFDDGILGVGGILQTNNTVNGTQFIPTWMDNLYAQGVIKEEVLGVYFAPLVNNATYQVNGEITSRSIVSLLDARCLQVEQLVE